MFDTTFKMPVRLGLQFFADGAAVAGGATGGNAPAGAEAADAGLTNNTDSGTDNVGADAEAGQAGTPDREAEFERLIKGDYKDLYDARVKKAVTGRTRTLGQKAKSYEAALPILDKLATRYGVKAGDTEALLKAFNADNTYNQARADETGVPLETINEMESLRTQAAARERAEAEATAAAEYAALLEEAKSVKAIYKNFDLRTELEGERFKNLLDIGYSMRDAYEIAHRDTLVPAAMKYASKKGEDAVANRVRQNGMRPSESGARANVPSSVKVDPSKLSMEQINEYIRRAERGEQITFT
ncbi:MAG: hypothetical protein E7589_01300 [Ruminococcaceae bacterium]|nr:hypothetical protein [Oscillospiraceae bacterium]